MICDAWNRSVVASAWRLKMPCKTGTFSGTDAVDGRIKVIVTGSNILTLERETALPVQIITRSDIERANIQTAAQLVNT